MSDTIAALATPPLSGAIGILRVSGPQAFAAAASVFVLPGEKPFAEAPERMLLMGKIRLGDVFLDKACAVRMVAPYSYTGEDMVELHMHGSLPVLRETLDALYQAGARPATPGEFTRRAFLHGKMSLSQAEAVMDLITAETRDAARNAMGQLESRIGRLYHEIYDRIAHMLAHFYAVVDYPEDDLPPARVSELQNTLTLCQKQLSGLLDTYGRGRLLREGVHCAIIGRPNVGKSSLMNALVGYDRSIVSHTPGTTRDMVEESALLGGIKLRLCDSAGIREESGEPIEAEGVERARALARGAELCFVVLDGSEPMEEGDRAVLDLVRDKPCVVLINKSDLPQRLERDFIEAAFLYVISVSALTGDGLDMVDSTLRRMYDTGTTLCDGSILTNGRQADAIRRMLAAVERALDALQAGVTHDAVLAELELSLGAASELTGRRVREDVIDRIFEQFCVGK